MIVGFKNFLKRLISWEKIKFYSLTKRYKLELDFEANRDAIRVLETVFLEEEYDLGFPVNENATILDVGSHYGYFTIYARKRLRNAKIISVEPSPRNIEIQSKNLKDNGIGNVVYIQKGLAKEKGSVPFYESSSYNHTIISKSKKEITGYIEVLSLQDVFETHKIKHVDFFKLDCEGAEYEIILNSTNEILSKIDVISLEFHDQRELGYSPEQLISKLENSGFKCLKFEYERDHSKRGLKFGKIVMKKMAK